MTEEQIRNLRQYCFQQASILMQFNGRTDSTAPTVAQVMAEADKLYDFIAGTPV